MAVDLAAGRRLHALGEARFHHVASVSECTSTHIVELASSLQWHVGFQLAALAAVFVTVQGNTRMSTSSSAATALALRGTWSRAVEPAHEQRTDCLLVPGVEPIGSAAHNPD